MRAKDGVHTRTHTHVPTTITHGTTNQSIPPLPPESFTIMTTVRAGELQVPALQGGRGGRGARAVPGYVGAGGGCVVARCFVFGCVVEGEKVGIRERPFQLGQAHTNQTKPPTTPKGAAGSAAAATTTTTTTTTTAARGPPRWPRARQPSTSSRPRQASGVGCLGPFPHCFSLIGGQACAVGCCVSFPFFTKLGLACAVG